MSARGDAAAESRRAAPHVVGAGAAAVLAAALVLPALWESGVPAAARWLAAVAVFLGCLTTQLRPLTLPWRGERMAIHPDEALIVAGVLYADGATAVVAAALAMLASQVLLRKRRLKVVFNTAVLLASSAVAVLVAQRLGVTLGQPHATLLLVPVLIAVVGQLAVATLLSRVTGRAAVLRAPQLTKSVLVQATVGVVLAGAAIALFETHLLAPLALVPVLWLCYRLLANEYRHETELEMRRVLAELSKRLVGETSERKVLEGGFAVLRQCLDLRAAEFTLTGGSGGPRTTREEYGPLNGAVLLHAPIAGAAGAPAGEMRLLVGGRGRRKREEDQELATLLASYLSMALQTMAALRSAKDAESRLRQAFDAARDAIVVIAEDGCAEYTNPTAREALEVRDGDRVLAALTQRLGGDTAAQVVALAGCADPSATLLATVPRSGSPSRYEVSATELTLSGGRPGILLVARDVTRRLELEEDAERQRQAIARHERLSAIGTLVAGVAHEVNNPLSYTRCNVEMLVADLELAMAEPAAPLDADLMLEQLKSVASGIERIATITGSLRVLARPRSGGDHARIRLDDLVREMVPLVQAGLPEGVRLEVRLAAGDGAVHGVEGEMQQAIMNLVTNAIEAVAATGGTVTITTQAVGPQVHIVVEDDGPGVPESQRAHLFNPFYTTKPGGTGLGLTTAQSSARASGGNIVFRPRAAGGAAFSMELPAALPDGEPDQATNSASTT